MRSENSDSFEDFYAAHWSPLIGLLIATGCDSSEAEEVAQDAFVRALVRWPRISGYEDPSGWLRLVAVRVMLSGKRRQRTARNALERQSRSVVQAPPPASVSVDLEAAMSSLNRSQRAVLLLHHAYGFSVEEIASSLDMRAGTVKSQLSRARDRLHPLLIDYEPR